MSIRSRLAVVLAFAMCLSSFTRVDVLAVPAQSHPDSEAPNAIATARRALDEAIAREKADPSKATSLAVEAALADYNSIVSKRAAELLGEMRELETDLAKPTTAGDVDVKTHSPARGDRRRALAARYDGLRAEFSRVAARSTKVLGSTTETEPNDTAANATAVDLTPACGIASGSISPAGDVDYYSFTAPAGSRVWAYVDTGGATAQGSQSRDSLLTLYGTDGTTLLERDDEDGSGNGCDSTTESLSASAIAGHAIAAAGTYYLRVEDFPGVAQTIDPYTLYVAVTTGSTPEAEPNDAGLQANALVPSGQSVGVRTGALATSGDVDVYSIQVENGASLLYVSADADPERDGIGTDVAIDLFTPEAGTLLFTSEGVVVADALAPLGSIPGLTPLYTADSSDRYGSPAPPAEGFCFLAPAAGTYYVRVRSTNDEVGTYSLMAVAAAPPPYGCPPLSIHGTLGEGSPDYSSQSGVQVGRLRRTGVSSICGTAKPCPGYYDITGTRRYDLYRFGNNSDETRCVTISLNSSCAEAGTLFGVAYANSFNPDDLCENYIADSGVDAGPNRTFSFNVGPRASFVLVLNELRTGSACVDYDFSVAGLPGCEQPPTDLSVTMTQADPVFAGQFQVYYITVANTGPTTLDNVNLTFQVPEGTQFYNLRPPQGSSNPWTCTTPPTGSSGTITCATPYLIGGTTDVFRLTVFIDASTPAGTTITNTATVTTTSPETDPTNNSVTISATVQHLANLQVVVVADQNPVQIGGLFTYTIVVYNFSPTTVTNVVLTDELSPATTFESISAPPGWTCKTPPVGSSGTVTCSIPTLSDIGPFEFLVTVRVNADLEDATVIDNTATASSDGIEQSPSDNSYTNQVVAYRLNDVSIFVQQAPDPAPIGGYVTFDITVKNAGPREAQDVLVYNYLPYGVTFVSCEASDGGVCISTDNPQTISFALIPSGGGATVRIVGRVTCLVESGSTLTDLAETSYSPYDVDLDNNYYYSHGLATLVPATISCPANRTIITGSPSGTAVTYPAPAVTPAGAPGGCFPASGSVFPVGTTIVNCSFTDACSNAVSCSFTVTVIPAQFDLCAVDDVTGDYFKVVTNAAVSDPTYGYWEYHRVNGPGTSDDQVFSGFANQITTSNRLVTIGDTDDPTYSMAAAFNRRTGRAEVSVRVLATNTRYRLTDATTFNSTCP